MKEFQINEFWSNDTCIGTFFNVATFETDTDEKPEGLYHPLKQVALDQRCHKLIKIQVTCHYKRVEYLLTCHW